MLTCFSTVAPEARRENTACCHEPNLAATRLRSLTYDVIEWLVCLVHWLGDSICNVSCTVGTVIVDRANQPMSFVTKRKINSAISDDAMQRLLYCYPNPWSCTCMHHAYLKQIAVSSKPCASTNLVFRAYSFEP